MPRHSVPGRQRRSALRSLILALACGWLLLVLSVLVSSPVLAFMTLQTTYAAPYASNTSPTNTPVPPTNTPVLATSTPTPTSGPSVTSTPSSTPNASPTVASTATATSAPSNGGGGGGGGGGQGGGGGPAGPNVTRVVYSQPTVGVSDNGPLQGLSPSAFGSNGLLLASTLSCVVALLGVIIAAIALLVLMRGGYGPFLKALLRGKRAGRKRGKQAKAGVAPGWNTSASSGAGYPGEAGYAPRGQGYRSGFHDSYDGYDDGYTPPPARSASRQARSPAPNARSRQGRR